MELYEVPALRSMMPAIKGFVGNEAHDACSASGYEWPPCIIIKRSESLQEWAQREHHDFVTILQVGPRMHACSALFLFLYTAILGGSDTRHSVRNVEISRIQNLPVPHMIT